MSDGERISREAMPAHAVVLAFLRSSVGAKVVMGLTGAALWAFVIAHLLGNLQLFQGADAINQYAVNLKTLFHGAAVWVMRAGLATCFVVHIVMGVRLAALNRAARGAVQYAKQKSRATSMMALTMASSGLLILAFLLFHLSHTTLGLVDPVAFALRDANDRPDVYKMMWTAFKQPWMVVIYIVGQSLLLSHLFHGTQSLWQSLGLFHPVWTPALRIAGRVLAAVIFILNLSMPLAVFFVWGQP